MDFQNNITFLFICVDALCLGQQFISHVITFPRLNHIAVDSRSKCSASSESKKLRPLTSTLVKHSTTESSYSLEIASY